MTAFDPIIDPDAILDYRWDWTAWLADGETISSVDWIVPDGITKDDTRSTHDATTATIWLSGATLGKSYNITCRITTSQDRTDDRTITLRCRER